MIKFEDVGSKLEEVGFKDILELGDLTSGQAEILSRTYNNGSNVCNVFFGPSDDIYNSGKYAVSIKPITHGGNRYA